MKRCLYAVFFLAILISRAKGDTDNINTQSTDLRKISASTIFQGLANTTSQVGKIAGSKTKKEKQENACNLVGTLFQFGAEASKEHEESKQKKKEQKEEKKKQKKEEEKSDSNDQESETKSIKTDYIEQFQELTSDEEKKYFLEAILQDKEATEKLIDELNLELKTVLIEALFE